MQISQLTSRNNLDSTETEIILAHALGKNRSFIKAFPEFKLNKTQENLVTQFIKRRLTNEPLAYILGCKEFYGLKFFVNKHVLIPRPETEDLVEKTVSYVKAKSNESSIYSSSAQLPVGESRSLLNVSYRQARTINTPIKICDVGTGSGCIAITLSKMLPKAKIFATDIDSKALEVAKKNAKYHKVEGKIKFVGGELLSPISEKVDIIVANLPYIPTEKISNLQPEIKIWEPKVALDGGGDGLVLYRKLFHQAKNVLKKRGQIFYEIDGDIKIETI